MTGFLILVAMTTALMIFVLHKDLNPPAPTRHEPLIVKRSGPPRDGRGRFLRQKPRPIEDSYWGPEPHPSWNGDKWDLFPHLAPHFPDGVPPSPGIPLNLGPGTKLNSKGEVVWIKTWNEKNHGHL